ncbi:MAG: 33 kDa chaperonin [Deltaproteobacteria bacterium ADurb.BinA179]|nr:MAG: 33 kDa chaperonin [Deltaproteobacteria bacterium ADurb.BinA179]
MEDYMVKAITESKDIIAVACVTTNLVNDARGRHGTYPTATAALGRALTGAELMASLLDPDQRVALKFQGDGPLKKILVEADGTGAARGYVGVPEVNLPPKNGKIDVSGALGSHGYLTVSKDLRVKDVYTGVVRLHSGEIASDIAYYFSESEQIPSAVGLGVFVERDGEVSAAGGFLVQSLPPSDDERIDAIVSRIEHMDSVTAQLRDGRLPEDILELILQDIPHYIIENRQLAFRCSCSRERTEQAVIALGAEEIRNIISDRESVDISCQLCGAVHTFSREELKRLIEEQH